MDPHHSLTPEQLLAENPRLGKPARRNAAIFGVIGIISLTLAYFLGGGQGDGMRHFYFAYLTAYCFGLSLVLGCLFYTIIHFLLRDGSSVVIRRTAENVAATIPVMALLVLPVIVPVLMGNTELYHWLDPHVRETDKLIAHKSAFLNLGFFIARLVAYFAIWTGLAWFFRRQSIRQDILNDKSITKRLWSFSAPAMLLFALSATFFAVDMIMSLDAHWFSTIFGVYFFAGCMVGAFALLTILTLAIQRAGHLRTAITPDHFHDLGKLMFAFLFFWGYIAFSQFMLYWYGNIPEETGWYIRRFEGEWLYLSVALLLLHLLIPFPIMLSRMVKRRSGLLVIMAVWMLIAHWIDMYWLIMPEFRNLTLPLSLLDLTCLIGVLGIMIATYLTLAGGHALVPLRDPNLAESLKFENV